MKNSKYNGSVYALAESFRDVIVEAVEPLRDEVGEIKGEMKDMESRLNKRIDTKNENVQVQLSQHRKDVKELLSKK